MTLNGQALNGQRLANRYRRGGLRVARADIEALLSRCTATPPCTSDIAKPAAVPIAAAPAAPADTLQITLG